jgi:hypothetical protein
VFLLYAAAPAEKSIMMPSLADFLFLIFQPQESIFLNERKFFRAVLTIETTLVNGKDQNIVEM